MTDQGLVECDTPDASDLIRVNLPLAEVDEVNGVPVEELVEMVLRGENPTVGNRVEELVDPYMHMNSFYVPSSADLERLLLKAVRHDFQREFRREIESLFNEREGRMSNNGKPLKPPRAGKSIKQPWKSCATVFRRLSYCPTTDTSVVACRPGVLFLF